MNIRCNAPWKKNNIVTGIRLTLALASGGLSLPEPARIAVFAPRAGADLSALPQDACHVITGFRPDHDHFDAAGFACAIAPEGRYDAALVCVPRARVQAHDLIAQAAAVTDGPVMIDGLKTDGIESTLKECRKRADVSAPISKAHGKLFWFTGGDFADWRAAGTTVIEDGFVTAPGVFSADGIDPASRFLADHLPANLAGHLADLGAGWGYLAARALAQCDKITQIDLVEGDHAALECARQNVSDPRAQFHWVDARHWKPATLLDAVLMNPPFHTGRKPDASLGRAFIAAAAGVLKPSGQLWMVANRHLPYEEPVNAAFGEVTEVAGDARFKLFHARRPVRHKR